MWEPICLTLAATAGNNIGKVLQKKGTIILPPLSLKLKVVKAYAFNKAWITGFLMDIFGAVLMLRALSLAPVSVIQPVSGCGLAILCIFSHFYLKEVMNVIDWVGIVLAGVGTIGDVILNTWLRICKRQRREQELMQSDVVEEIIFGLESGILFGMASVISKMGFVFLEQGSSQMLVPVCLLISVCCSGTGFVYQTRGLKHGRAIVVSTCAAVASIVTGVLAGMFLLGEQLPSAPAARLLLLLGWVLIIFGVILLVSSRRLIQHLPRSLRRLVRSSTERSNNLRRSSSLRTRESNPSAVIQATTLHHLLTTSTTKEKA